MVTTKKITKIYIEKEVREHQKSTLGKHTHIFQLMHLGLSLFCFLKQFHFGGFAVKIHTALNKIIKPHVRNLFQISIHNALLMFRAL